ncbi:MAG TPA: hypothetical protein VHZ78_08565 [Rhizomicrobium sp.]|jgi:hypothetical protein|nr:hypothetical protein [Rhizomicrobium sp.]
MTYSVSKKFNTHVRRFAVGTMLGPDEDLSPHRFGNLVAQGFIVRDGAAPSVDAALEAEHLPQIGNLQGE